jgi:putative ABC transport system permease protein
VRLAVRELLRRPSRFIVAGGALTLLTLLLLFLGGLLDGLFRGSTGALRIQQADGIVFDVDARRSLLRSQLDAEVGAAVDAVDGVAATGGLGVALLGLQVPDEEQIADGAVIGYELGGGGLPEPPEPGTAWADRRLEGFGAEVGDVLLVGPAQEPLEIVGWVDDSNYLLQNGLWVEPDTWRRIQNANRPDAAVAADEFQALLVRVAGDADPAAVRAAIDGATAGRTETISIDDAVFSLPGIREQSATFGAIIYTTLFVVGLVVALFFALVTLERTSLYAVLKAVGTPDRELALGLVVQAVAVAAGAFVVGGLLTLGLAAAIPAEVPLELTVGRAAFVAVGLVVTAVAGGLVSLRRIIRIDPASAIGTGV